MDRFLKNLYQRFLAFEKESIINDSRKHSTSLQKLEIPLPIIEAYYENYYKTTYLDFLNSVKRIIYAESVYEFILKKIQDDWKLNRLLSFLKKENIIKITRAGRPVVVNKDISTVIPEPQTEDQIIKKIEAALGVEVKADEPVLNLLKGHQHFSVKAGWDQMPISQGSAVFVVKKILEEIPLNKKFLFVGDDDFISLFLSLADPTIESLVVDADEQLLECIDALAQKFDLPIETRKMDLMKARRIGETFVGFLTNPMYTAEGIKKFISFGLRQLGNDGGMVFLEMGDEAIRNRLLDLQRFFAARNLITTEIITGKIAYPHIMLYEEDREIFDRLALLMDKKVIRTSPKLGAAFYIFRYLPFKPQPINYKTPAYAYL